MENKKLLNLENCKLFIVFMMFVLLYCFQNNTEIWISTIPFLLVIGFFLFSDNIFIEIIMTFGLAFLLYKISKQRQDFFILVSILFYFSLILLQKICEKKNQYIYFTVNLGLALFRFYFFSRLIDALPKSEDCINLETFTNVAILFAEALFNTLYENKKKERSEIENKPFLILFQLFCKSCGLVFFLIYEISIFFIHPNNWILFICFNLCIFIVLFYKIQSDKTEKEANKSI